ncbi:MAG: T9SS type A sorting domain-containing protein [Cyclonatronaceae bacterium]
MKNWFMIGLFMLTGVMADVQAAMQATGDGDGEPASPTVIQIAADPDTPMLGDAFDVVFSTPDAEGIYYIEAEIGIDPLAFQLAGMQPGELFGSEALYVGDYNAANRIGFSITSTGGTLSGSGGLFVLNITVPETASAGSYNLSVYTLQVRDAEGNLMETDHPVSIGLTIRSYISWVNLQSPAMESIEYGFSVSAEARVIVPDITSISGENADIEAWIGVSADAGNPALWAENDWLPAEYIQRTGTAHVYRRSVGQDLPSGTWFLASRFRYENGDYFYGGYSEEGGGFWDGTTNISGVLVINEPGNMVVAEWNFNDDSRIASRGIFANLSKEFSLAGANFSGFVTGSPGRAATSNGWNGNDPDLEKYWLADFTTSGLHDLKLSFKMKSSGTGPRDFMLQSSLDAETWTDLLDDPLQLTDNFNGTNIQDFVLPAGLHDQPDVYLRWLLVSDRRVNESDDPVTSTGSSQIDEVKITGRPLLAQFPVVWPGDTNNDGFVDETDVLPLGFFWRSSGPARAVTGSVWQEVPAVGWLPLNATYADTDGSGTVNQSDLLAVGLNFGKTRGVLDPDPDPDPDIAGQISDGSQTLAGIPTGTGVVNAAGSQSGSGTNNYPGNDTVTKMFTSVVTDEHKDAATEITFPRLDDGKMLEIDILTTSDEQLNILGVSYTYSITSGNDHTADVRYASPGDWARNGFDPGTMLRFQKTEDNTIAGAVVHKGLVETGLTGNLLMIRIAANTDWDDPITLGDFRFSYMDENGRINRLDIVKLNHRIVTATGITHQPDIPQDYRLYQNYPNPFNPETTVRFELPESADVTLDVYTITGQHVATLVDEFRTAGHHHVTFDGSRLSSGVYMYRLKTDQVIMTRKMTLVK